jgi:hypothetical protein
VRSIRNRRLTFSFHTAAHRIVGLALVGFARTI